MSITLFGGIWLVYLIYCFLSSDHRKMLFAALLSMVFQCNNILYFGDTGIGTQVFTIGVAWTRLLLIRPLKEKIRPLMMLSALVLGILGAVVLSLVVNRLLYGDSIIAIAMIGVYVLFLVTLSQKRLRVDEPWMERTENRILIVVLVIGALQVLCKSGADVLTLPLQWLVYNDVDNSDVIFSYKELNRFYATFMEPSYCGAYLVGMFALLMLRQRMTVKNLVLGVLTCTAIVLTRSSTAYGGVVIVGILLLVTHAKKKVFKFLLPAFLLAGLGLAIFNMDLLNEVIFEKAQTGSFTTRARLNQLALVEFISNPAFGSGYRSVRASSIWYTLLGEQGVVGCGVYLFLVAVVLWWAIRGEKSPAASSKSFFVLGIVICQFIACPDLNFSPFWMALYALAMALQIDARRPVKEEE